jgi:hypothetical protein
MLRKKLFGCTVVVAMLAAPVTLSARSMGGFGGHGFGGMHSFSGVHSFGGMRSFGMSSGWGGTHSFHHAFLPSRHFAHFDHFHHFARFHHFRHHFPIFATAIGVGYSSCWEWVPTPYGWRRIWVCDSYY